jgi:hypothetical protein
MLVTWKPPTKTAKRTCETLGKKMLKHVLLLITMIAVSTGAMAQNAATRRVVQTCDGIAKIFWSKAIWLTWPAYKATDCD